GQGDDGGAGEDGGAADGDSDPGNGNWLWAPSNDRVIAYRGGSIQAFLPGCLNGQFASNSATGCATSVSYTAVLAGTNTYYTFTFGNSRILGLRYVSKANAGSSVKYFQINGGSGGNPGPVKMWLSTSATASYTDAAAVNSYCAASTSISAAYLLTGPGYCPVSPNTRYYLFIQTDVTGYNPTYQLVDSTSDFIVP
ncbi:MAG: hypothetical protein ACP5QK_11500, partial [Myxococcota bacterium]